MAAKALLDGDANPNVKSADKENGWTALTIASAYGHYATVQTLLNGGADVNLARKGDDMTPLILAVSHSHFPPVVHPGARHKEIVQALLEAGADVNAKDTYGETALLEAVVSWRSHDFVKALLEAGADVNAMDNDDKTALMLADENGHSEIVELLKQAGAKE